MQAGGGGAHGLFSSKTPGWRLVFKGMFTNCIMLFLKREPAANYRNTPRVTVTTVQLQLAHQIRKSVCVFTYMSHSAGGGTNRVSWLPILFVVVSKTGKLVFAVPVHA